MPVRSPGLAEDALAATLGGDESGADWCFTSRMALGPDVGDWCRRYGPMVLRCRRLLGDESDARDACQDVFVRVLERGARLRDQYPSSLLFRIATNVCLNRLRDRRRRPEGHRLESGDDTAALLDRIACTREPGAESEARLTLARLFGRHPESSRTMAVLHYVDGLTLEEVADLTGLSVSGVRKRLRRLRDTARLDEPAGPTG